MVFRVGELLYIDNSDSSIKIQVERFVEVLNSTLSTHVSETSASSQIMTIILRHVTYLLVQS